MWKIEQIDLDDRTTEFSILQNGKYITHQEWAALLKSNSKFRDFYNSILQDSNFSSFFWETRPVNTNLWDAPFRFVLVESKTLERIQANSRSFQSHFIDGELVVSFPNLGGDAQLVVPTKYSDDFCYGHIAAFVRNAPLEQVNLFWKQVSIEYSKKIGYQTIWLSTAGLGVPWLHVRIDSRPKYYRHQEYKTLK